MAQRAGEKIILASGIDVGPTFINFGFFPGPTFLLYALRLLIFAILSRPYRYFQFWSILFLFFNISLHILFCRIFFIMVTHQVFISQDPTFILFVNFFRPYIYSFCPIFYALCLFKDLRLFFWQIFQALRLFPAIRLFRSLEYVI